MNNNNNQHTKQQQRQRQYTVLYYKRTTKVHKNRGVQRYDGTLSISAPPSCLVTLTADPSTSESAVNDNDCGEDEEGEEEYGGNKYGRKNGKKKTNKKKKGGGSYSNSNNSNNNGVVYSGVNIELAKRAFYNYNNNNNEEEERGGKKRKTMTGTTTSSSSSSNGVNNNIVGPIEEDEEIVLSGQWECQIVSALQEVAQQQGQQEEQGDIMNNNGTATKMKSSSVIIGTQKNNNRMTSSSVMVKKKPLLMKRGSNSVVGGSSSSSSLLLSRRPPPQPTVGKKMKKEVEDIDDEDDEDDEGEGKAATTTTTTVVTLKKKDIPSSLMRGGASSTTTINAGLIRRPQLGTGSLVAGGLMKRSTNVKSLVTTSTKSFSSTTKGAVTKVATVSKVGASTTTTSNNNNSNNNFFPGALGSKINIPNSIREVLRPHQCSGIAFLWNCVTGVSPGLNNAIVRAQSAAAAAAASSSCSSSLGSMSSFDLDDEDEDSDMDNDGGDQKMKKLEGGSSSTNINNITMPKGAVLADEMGLGKTLMTIATIFALHRRQRDRRFIVVCPSSLVSNWAKEFDKWIGKASQPKRVIVRNGNEEGLRKLRAFVPLKPQSSEVLILSYELFRLHVKVICHAPKIGLLVVDEGHRLKNTSGSQTLSALNSIKAESRILITGTPIQNNLSEFYTVANFAVPGILGDLNTFRRVYERPMSRANQKNATLDQKEKGRQQSKLLDSITSTFVLRRLQKDVLKSMLPPRKEILLFCRPTKRQCQLYKNISDRATKSIGSIGGIEECNNPLMLLTEARKLCTHPSLLEEAGDSSLELSGKMIILSSLLDSIRQNNPTDKVVIISNFTSALTVIEDSILRKKKLPFVRLDGSTDNSSRGPLVDSFNNRSVDHSFAFMLSSKAGGCGLNLIGANRLIMVDADWNPATDHQSMARIYRQGQTKPCFIYRLFTTGTCEEIIYQRQIQKGNLAKIANDGGSKKASSSTNASFTKEELRDCFTLKEGIKCDTKKKLGRKWSDYTGADSLRDLGCVDEPLLGVCDDKAETLSFVHLVDDDDEEEAAASADLDDVGGDVKGKASEDDDSLGLGSESSSEEEEFDG